MKYELLDTVVVERDFSDHGLRRGDLGTIVEPYPPNGLEVEFVAGSGKTRRFSLCARMMSVRREMAI